MLFDEFPVTVSFPEPPIAFSIIVPAEITRFPVRPAIFELKSEFEFLSIDLRSIF